MAKEKRIFQQMLDKKKEIEANQTAIFRAYGQFAIEFEQLIESIRFCVSLNLEVFGLKTSNGVADLLLADMTAFELVNKCRGLVYETYKDRKNGQDVVSHLRPLFVNTIELYKLRNVVIHGTWEVPNLVRVLSGDLTNVKGMKVKATAKGVRKDFYKHSPNDIDAWTACIKSASDAFTILGSCFTKDYDVKEMISSDIIGSSALSRIEEVKKSS